MRIYKYDIPINGSIMLPAGSQILSVGIQDDQVRVWILLDPDAPKTEAYAFRVVGTGWDVDRDSLGIFIGTVRDGGFVWHVFARGVLPCGHKGWDADRCGECGRTRPVKEPK